MQCVYNMAGMNNIARLAASRDILSLPVADVTVTFPPFFIIFMSFIIII